MSTITAPAAPSVKVPKNREEFRLLVIATRSKQAQGVSIAAERDQLISEATAAVEKEHKFAARIQKNDAEIVANLAVIEQWAADNREAEFGEAKTIKEGGVKIGWSSPRWSVLIKGDSEKDADNTRASMGLLAVIISKGEKEGASAKAKERAEIAKRYLATKVELSKSAVLKDREDKQAAKLLEEVNITFEQGAETFVFEPLAS